MLVGALADLLAGGCTAVHVRSRCPQKGSTRALAFDALRNWKRQWRAGLSSACQEAIVIAAAARHSAVLHLGTLGITKALFHFSIAMLVEIGRAHV